MTPASLTEDGIAKTDDRPGKAWIALFLMVLALGTALRLINHNVPNPTPDEKSYGYYAESILHDPIGAPGVLVKNYNSHPDRWIYPTPIRVGYYYLLAAVMKCSGIASASAGVSVSVAFSILQLFIVAVIGLRFFDRWTTLVALALMSVCPMDLAIARRVWQDGVVGCTGLLLFYFCMEASLRPVKKKWLGLFWATGFLFLLLKESTGPVFGFYCMWLTGVGWMRKLPLKQCAGIATGCVLTGLLSFVTMAVLSGGIPNVIEVVVHSKQTMPLNRYAVDFQNGPWYSFPLGWWILSPVAASLCFLGMGGWLIPGQRLRRAAAPGDDQCLVVWAMVASVFFVTAMLTFPAYLMNLRYVSFIYGTVYLLSGLGFRWLVEMCRENFSPSSRHRVTVAAAAILAVVMAMDFCTFHRIFIKGGLDDLAIIRVIDRVFK